jgi:hypothetical protein
MVLEKAKARHSEESGGVTVTHIGPESMDKSGIKDYSRDISKITSLEIEDLHPTLLHARVCVNRQSKSVNKAWLFPVLLDQTGNITTFRSRLRKNSPGLKDLDRLISWSDVRKFA